MKRLSILSLCLVLAAALLLSRLAFPVSADETTPLISNNQGGHDYINIGRWTTPVKSHLIANADGSFTRVEAGTDIVAVENYTADGQFLSRQDLSWELPLFGGFYAGADYNFLVFGQSNPEEDDAAEVIRVVRYTKDWARVDHASLFGANTYTPFDGGSLRMVQYGDMLYVRTCHVMYASDDGLHHQANLTFSLRIADMTITDSQYEVAWAGRGYASHSFNQFIATDADKLVAVDHGDAYPRSIVLFRYNKSAGNDTFVDSNCESYDLLEITGDIGANDTGVSVGGFQVSDTAYLTALSTVVQEDGADFFGPRGIVLCVTGKQTMETTLRWLVEPQTGVTVSNPHLIALGSDEYLLLWNAGTTLYYVFTDGNGQPTSPIYSGTAPLSDCVPVVSGDRVVWYVTSRSAPTFYAIDLRQPDTVGKLEPHTHSYESSVTNPTCTDQGYTTYTCACGDTYVSDYTAALGHSYADSVCTRCGEQDPDAPALSDGLHKGEDGNYYYYAGGAIDYDFVGLVENSFGNWYVENGMIQFGKNGLVTYQGTKYYIKGGCVNNFTGVKKLDGVYYYFTNGVNDLEFKGLVEVNNAKFYVRNGQIDFNFTDMVDDNGTLRYVRYGMFANTKTGLVKGSDGVWRYVENGVFTGTYTGLGKNVDWYYVENSLVNFKFTGVAAYNGSYWYVKWGFVDFTFNGEYTYNGVTYQFVNGQAQ